MANLFLCLPRQLL